MGTRKMYNPLGIEIGLWNKDSSVFYVECDCGKYYKKQRGQYIETQSID